MKVCGSKVQWVTSNSVRGRRTFGNWVISSIVESNEILRASLHELSLIFVAESFRQSLFALKIKKYPINLSSKFVVEKCCQKSSSKIVVKISCQKSSSKFVVKICRQTSASKIVVKNRCQISSSKIVVKISRQN